MKATVEQPFPIKSGKPASSSDDGFVEGWFWSFAVGIWQGLVYLTKFIFRS
jgi:hypothetical protein